MSFAFFLLLFPHFFNFFFSLVVAKQVWKNGRAGLQIIFGSSPSPPPPLRYRKPKAIFVASSAPDMVRERQERHHGHCGPPTLHTNAKQETIVWKVAWISWFFRTSSLFSGVIDLCNIWQTNYAQTYLLSKSYSWFHQCTLGWNIPGEALYSP